MILSYSSESRVQLLAREREPPLAANLVTPHCALPLWPKGNSSRMPAGDSNADSRRRANGSEVSCAETTGSRSASPSAQKFAFRLRTAAGFGLSGSLCFVCAAFLEKIEEWNVHSLNGPPL